MGKEERLLKKFLEFLIGKAGILNDSLESIWIKSFMIRDGYTMSSVGHAGVFTFADNLEACFTECLDRTFSRDISKDHFRQEPLPDIPSNPLFPLLSCGGKC